MKNIKFLIFAFVAVNLSVISAFSANKASADLTKAASDSEVFSQLKFFTAVCANEQCFKKIEDAFSNVNCGLVVHSAEVVDFERAFPEKATFRKYKLIGCMKPVPQDDAAGLAIDEKMQYKCLDGYKTDLVKIEGRHKKICIEDDSQKREKINHEAKDLKKKVNQIK